MKVKVAQSCRILCNPMDDTVHRILQAKIVEWDPSSRGSSQSTDQTQVFHIEGKYFTNWITREAWVCKSQDHVPHWDILLTDHMLLESWHNNMFLSILNAHALCSAILKTWIWNAFKGLYFRTQGMSIKDTQKHVIMSGLKEHMVS